MISNALPMMNASVWFILRREKDLQEILKKPRLHCPKLSGFNDIFLVTLGASLHPMDRSERHRIRSHNPII